MTRKQLENQVRLLEIAVNGISDILEAFPEGSGSHQHWTQELIKAQVEYDHAKTLQDLQELF